MITMTLVPDSSQRTGRTFCYEFLLEPNQIRLLAILPGEPHEMIGCLILTVSLDDKLLYEAISYTWGGLLRTYAIHVNGSQYCVLGILHGTFQRFRHANLPKFVWIDAICINQTNIQERTQQVQIMRNIYLQAQHVLIWLYGFLLRT